MRPLEVIKAVSLRRGVEIEDILSHKRTMGLVNARAEICIILRNFLKLSYPEIGEIMMRDHTSVIHLVKTSKVQVGMEVQSFEEQESRNGVLDGGFHLIQTSGGGRKWSVLMQERKGICEIPGCNFGDVLEVHHLISRKLNGGDHRSNVIVLCPNHHRMLHHGLVKLKPSAFPHLIIPLALRTFSGENSENL